MHAWAGPIDQFRIVWQARVTAGRGRHAMAYVSGYDHDVFVSYAHADEAADASGKWATQFVDCLRGALKLRLGGSEELRIFFDTESLGSNQQLGEMLTAARRSAVFLAIA